MAYSRCCLVFSWAPSDVSQRRTWFICAAPTWPFPSGSAWTLGSGRDVVAPWSYCECYIYICIYNTYKTAHISTRIGRWTYVTSSIVDETDFGSFPRRKMQSIFLGTAVWHASLRTMTGSWWWRHFFLLQSPSLSLTRCIFYQVTITIMVTWLMMVMLLSL